MAKPLPLWKTHEAESLQPFSKIRLIVADLDGTTLKPSKQLLYATIQKLRRDLFHHRYNVNFTIATGRTFEGASALLKSISLPRKMPIILYNGSLVVGKAKETVYLKRSIPITGLRRVIDICSAYPVRVLAYYFQDFTDRIFRSSRPLEYVLGWSRVRQPEREFNNMIVRWHNDIPSFEDHQPLAILIDTSEAPNMAEEIECKMNDINEITVTRSGSSYIELRPKGSNKGEAIKRLAELLELKRDEVLAFGDNDNDVEMLSWAGIGVAVAGASSMALESSNYVCRYGVSKGAVELLRLIKNARRYYYLVS